MATASVKTIQAIVAGTGFENRAERIRAFCKEGAPVQLRREPDNKHDPEAIAVWMRCSVFLGLWKPWAQIGYIKAPRADSLAPKLDSGAYTVRSAIVRSLYAPKGRDHPRVSLEIEFVVRGD